MKKFAPYLVLSAGILWGMIGLFVRRLTILGFGSMDIVAIRAITTTVLLGLFLLLYDKKMLRIRFRDLWCFAGTGILSIVFFNYCYFRAITLTSLSVAAILLYTAPAIVMILSAILFRERITGRKLTSLLLTFVGCVFVTGVVSGGEALCADGILVGLGAGLGYALYSVFSRFALERGYHSLTISFFTFLFAAFGTILFANDTGIAAIVMQNPGIIGFCLLFGLISTVLPYIAYTRGLQEMENGKASIIASIEPAAAALLGVIAYHEQLTAMELSGIVLVLTAITVSNLGATKA